MNIQDILRGLPFPMQGALMSVFGATQGEDPQQPVASTTSAPQAGGGRGFVNPAVVRPTAARPVGVSVPSDDGTTPGILAQINEMQAPSAASLAPDNRDIGGGQSFVNSPMQAAMQAPSGNPTEMGPQQGPQSVPALKGYEQGILSKIADGLDKQFGFSQPDFLGRLGTALAVAGSQDPVKAMMEVRQQRMEAVKNQEAIRRANQPKFTPLQNGAFVMAEVPGMAPQILPISQVQNFIRETEKMKTMSETEKAVFLEQLKNKLKTDSEVAKENRAGEGERVQAGLNVQQLNQIADSLEKTDTASGPIIGLLPKFVRDIITPQGASLQDAAERIVQGGLRATLGGQFTQAEGDRFLARAYNPRLSEEQNAQNLRTIAREIAAMQLDKKAALDYFQRNGTLEGFTPNANAGSAPAAPAGGVARPASKADFDALPKGSRFIAPDGKEYIK